MKILIVDDSATQRRIMRNIIRSMEPDPPTVVEAADGREALKILDASIDVVLTDWHMPNLGGVDLVRRIRADPVLARIPIIMVTTAKTRDAVVEAMNAGATTYIVKPFTKDALREKVDKVLGAVQASPAAAPSGEEPWRDYIDPGKQLVMVVWKGTVTEADLLVHRSALRQHPDFDPAFPILIDCRNVTAVRWTPDGLKTAATQDPYGDRSRRALVADRADVVAMARVYETYAPGDWFRIFADVAAAREWLGRS